MSGGCATARYDVTALLSSPSVLGVALGNGWYRGRLGWNGNSALYGDELGASGQLEIEFEDGHIQDVVSDTSWQAGPSDDCTTTCTTARRSTPGCGGHHGSTPDLLPHWTGVHLVEFDDAARRRTSARAWCARRTLRPAVWTSPNGATLVDFGQNLVGWVRLRVRGERRRHDHSAARRGPRGRRARHPAAAQRPSDRPVRPSGGEDVFEPTMTFHGFRYVEVSGWPGEARPR